MILLELCALGIIALYLEIRVRFGPEPNRFLRRLAIIVAASWLAEDTAIRAYGFYAYNPDWSVFVDRVPLAVIVIWPAVIHSAWDVARHLLNDARERALARKRARLGWVPLLGGAMVLADASLIEPVSVQAGLWWWTEPGLFAVPPIGLLGWAYFAGLCMAVFEHNDRRGRRPLADLAAIIVAPLGTHLLLLATWWGALRWVNCTVDPWPVVVGVWVLSLALVAWILRTGARQRVPPGELWTRVPAALYFFVLLLVYGRGELALMLYAFAFAPPYIALTRWPRRRG